MTQIQIYDKCNFCYVINNMRFQVIQRISYARTWI